MYDINVKNVKKQKGFYFIFFLAGLLFLVIMGAILFSSISKEKQMDASVMSTRVEIKESRNSDGETMYSPIYYYEVNGEEYACKSSSSSNIYPSEENKLVKYNSKAPGSCVTAYDKNSNMILLLFMLIPILFIVIGILNILKVNKRVQQIKNLNDIGKLVKGLPYRMENTGTVVNNVPIQRPVIDYVLPTGTVVTLNGDPRHNRKHIDSDGLVDLVIDENNPENYFIDFEINRLSGNLPTDYYINQNPTNNDARLQQMMEQQMMYGQVPVQPGYNQVPTQPGYGQVPVQPGYNQVPTQPGYNQEPTQPMNNGQYPNQNNMMQ